MTDLFGTTQGVLATGGVIGIASFALGLASRSLLPWMKTLRLGRTESDRRNLAMLTVLALDDYVGACYSAVHDLPEFNPENQIEFVFHAPEPALALPKDADWRLLGDDLGEQIMWFSNRVQNLEHALDSIDLDRPNYGGFFERRLEGYSRIAASAMDLIARICGQYELTMPEKPDYYQQAEGFSKILRKVEDSAIRQAASVESEAELTSNVTQLFPKSV